MTPTYHLYPTYSWRHYNCMSSLHLHREKRVIGAYWPRIEDEEGIGERKEGRREGALRVATALPPPARVV